MLSGPTALQANEIVKCGKDPVYFINKYVKIQHSVRGLLDFKTFEFQNNCLKAFNEHRFNVVNKSRQLGLSTVSAAYAVWLAIFYKEKNILIIATKLAIAQNLIKKVKTAIDSLPKWLLMPEITERTKQHITFSNGSQIKAIPTSDDAGRSEALSLLVVDEAAFIRNFDEIWKGLYSTLTTGGRAIIISTPNGIGGTYQKLCEDAKNKVNTFNYIELPWTVHPERNQAWFEAETKNMSKKQIAQELLCDFSASGDTFVSIDIVDMLTANLEIPQITWGPENCVWQWRHAEPGRQYIISADIARGDSADYSAFHILDIELCEQVAEYKGKIPPDKFAYLLAEAGKKFNNALICPENNSFGYTTILKLFEIGYKNLYFKNEKDKFDALYGSDKSDMINKIGFQTNAGTRAPMLTLLEERLRNNVLRIRSSRLIEELRTFVWKGERAQAKKGENDDLIISLAIGNSLIDAKNQHTNSNNTNLAQAMLSAFAINAKTDTSKQTIKHYNNRTLYYSARQFEQFQNENNVQLDLTWLVK